MIALYQRRFLTLFTKEEEVHAHLDKNEIRWERTGLPEWFPRLAEFHLVISTKTNDPTHFFTAEDLKTMTNDCSMTTRKQ